MIPPAAARSDAHARILATAAQFFARNGYNGVSTREIAAAAAVNEVTIYRHYPRKRDLYLAVLSTELQSVQLRGELLTRLAEASNGRNALSCTFDLISSALRQKPQLLRLLQFGALEMDENIAPLLRVHLGQLVEVLAHYLQPWLERGQLRGKDAKSLVLTLIAIVLSRGPLDRLFLMDQTSSSALFETYSEFCAV